MAPLLNEQVLKRNLERMLSNRLFFVIVLLMHIFSVDCIASQSISIPLNQSPVSPYSSTSYFIDKSNSLDVTSVMNLSEDEWIPVGSEMPSYGFDTANYWFFLKLTNTKSAPETVYLSIDNPIINLIELFQVSDDYISDPIITGNRLPFSERPTSDLGYVFPLTLMAGLTTEVYIRVLTETSIQIPISLSDKVAIEERRISSNILKGILLGAILIMLVYNLFLWLSIRNRSNAYYILLLVGMVLFTVSTRGLGHKYLWPSLPVLNGYMVLFSSTLYGFSSLLFSERILQLKDSHATLHYAMTANRYLFLILMPLIAVLPYSMILKCLIVLFITSPVLCWIGGVLAWRGGNRSAKYFTLAFSALFIGIIIYGLAKFNIIQSGYWTENSAWFAGTLQVALLSFSLADSINSEKQARQKAEKDVLEVRLDGYRQGLKEKEKAIRAEAENKAKSDFLSTISHEIRTPLNGMIGMIQLLKETDASIEQEEYLSIISSSSNTLVSLVNDILDYSKIEAGKMGIENIPIDLNGLLKDVAALFDHNINRNSDVQFKLDIKSEVPRYVLGDPTRIRQVLSNYLSNANKFTKQGTVTLRVLVDEDALLFEVIDSGVGIGEDALTKLFRPYEQAESSTSRKYGGTGLGLSICKSLANLMEGSVGARSELGNGSTFWIRLPLEEIGADQITKMEAADTYVDLSDIRALIVDDHTVNRFVLNKMLAKFNAAPDQASDGEIAVEKYEENPYDLIFMDFNMAKMNGVEATIKIREYEARNHLKHSTIISLSANASEDDKAKCLKAGMDCSLSKPITIDALKSSMREQFVS